MKYFFFLSFIFIAGCNSVTPVIDTMKAVTGVGEGHNAPLVAGIEYLQVNANGHKAMMALGYRTFPSPDTNQEDLTGQNLDRRQKSLKNTHLYSPDQFIHEFWYSGQREMIEIVEGRIISVMGMTTEWRQTNTTAPNWAFVSSTETPTSWNRSRDLMPGYRFNFKDRVTTKQVKPSKLINLYPENATFFQDEIESKDKDGSLWTYKQLFVILNGKVIYSEQCIASDLCLKLKYIGKVVN
jgi:hypothetical protein